MAKPYVITVFGVTQFGERESTVVSPSSLLAFLSLFALFPFDTSRNSQQKDFISVIPFVVGDKAWARLRQIRLIGQTVLL